MKIIYTIHAEEMLKFRNIAKSLVDKCIRNPDQIISAREGKKIYLKDFGNKYLKTIAAGEEKHMVIVTVYWLAKRRLKS